MIINNIINELYREKDNPHRLLTNSIVIHYDGVDYQTSGIQLAKNIARSSVSSKKDANTLQYHYRICRNGDILYCVDDKDRLWHCGNYLRNLFSLSLCLEGIGYTDEQRSSLSQLIGYLKDKYSKTLIVYGHRDFQKTSCPGNLAYQDISNLNKVLGAQTIMANKYSKGDILKLTTSERNIRSDAGTQFGTVHILKKNETVFLNSSDIKESNGYTWINVNYGEGEGWTIDTNWTKTGVVASDNTKIKEQIINLANQIK